MVRHLEGLVLSPGRQPLAGCSEGGTSPCGSSGAWSQRTDLHLPSIFHGNKEALNPHTFYTMLIKVKSPWYNNAHPVTIGVLSTITPSYCVASYPSRDHFLTKASNNQQLCTTNYVASKFLCYAGMACKMLSPFKVCQWLLEAPVSDGGHQLGRAGETDTRG